MMTKWGGMFAAEACPMLSLLSIVSTSLRTSNPADSPALYFVEPDIVSTRDDPVPHECLADASMK
jgi:hypothetical protein